MKSIIELFAHVSAIKADLKEQYRIKFRKNKIDLGRGTVLDPTNHPSNKK
jgi:hypothetical protein